MDSLSPLPQYCAAKIEPPAVMDITNKVSTSTTCVARDTAAIESCERKSSMMASDTGTNANTKFCSVIGRISEMSFFLNDVSLICVMCQIYPIFPIKLSRIGILTRKMIKIKRFLGHFRKNRHSINTFLLYINYFCPLFVPSALLSSECKTGTFM